MTTTAANNSTPEDLHLLGPPRPEKRESGGWWFSCCVPKQQQQSNNNKKRASGDGAETERTLDITERGSDDTDNAAKAAGAAVLDPSEMKTFLDAVDADKAAADRESLVRQNSAAAVKPVATNLAQEILHAIMGILMINYFLEVFHHNRDQQPQRIAAAAAGGGGGGDDADKPKPTPAAAE